jgi:hypothetical protein
MLSNAAFDGHIQSKPRVVRLYKSHLHEGCFHITNNPTRTSKLTRLSASIEVSKHPRHTAQNLSLRSQRRLLYLHQLHSYIVINSSSSYPSLYSTIITTPTTPTTHPTLTLNPLAAPLSSGTSPSAPLTCLCTLSPNCPRTLPPGKYCRSN